MAFQPKSPWSPAQRDTLAAVCDTFVARLTDEEETELLQKAKGVDPDHLRAFCKSSGTDLGAHLAIEATMTKHLPPSMVADFGFALGALSSRVGMLTLFGKAAPFAELTLSERTQCLHELRNSRFAQKRKLFSVFKTLVCLHSFGRDVREMNPNNHASEKNSVWASLGYDGPAPANEVRQASGCMEFVFAMLNDSIARDTLIRCDVVVIGSGCGGSVVAAELANAGRRVVVLEKGKYFKRSALSGVEAEAFGTLYERGGLLTAEDSGISILCGSTFGGGSAVNWACSLKTPQFVKEEWATQRGLSAFTDGTYDASMQAVASRLRLKSDEVAHNKNNQWLIDGCKKLGYHVETAPQALADVTPHAPGANFIGNGDRFGIKEGVLKTFLVDAATAPEPAQFVDRCYVDRILHCGGVTKGVSAHCVGADGTSEYRLVVHAPIVVVSCGSINSPALLLRSGLPNRNGLIGKNLRIHPVVGVGGFMSEHRSDVKYWNGAPMTAVSNQVVCGPHGDNYGAKIECPLVHPGLMASVSLWTSPKAFKSLALDFRRTMALLALTRDKGSGEVKIHGDGTPRVNYTLCKHDEESLSHALACAVRIIAAAGAEKLMYAGMADVVTLPPATEPEARASAVERFIEEMRSVGFVPYKIPVMSAHQMGTCQMGTNPASSVVKASCESWECSGLYVADASTFPTPVGSNPMMTTYAVAHMAAQSMKRAGTEAAASAPPARL
mmetsp:Transcript_85641/g.247224  ORF Transcript_85641/g.247224 Transcript_85641/m.247224 type:complete len:726 (-) Transcript_85641:269-2446(-)